MLVFSGYKDVPQTARNAVVALGNFDGVHRGHAALLAEARRVADSCGAKLAVLTFEPHPRSFLNPGNPPFRLTTAEGKQRLLAESGVDILYVLAFDEALAGMDAATFQNRVLRDGLGPIAVAAGPDFRFGRRREGTLAGLAERDPMLQIITPAIARTKAGREISSTRIRAALQAGKPRDAMALLGHAWEIEYAVETGDRRGRTLGYPTANGRLGELIRPAFGIYAVRARLDDGRVFRGAANIGVRPMWQSDQPLVETHLFDMDEDIYGRTLHVELVEYLRAEARFDSVESLKEQMGKDCDRARTILASVN